ncbi:hypothetical protein CPB83DRAFT_210043 [Crepidotus variabilis]|uniref:C2H2-type domain-containing protein n=1 Tax=Crepidotus variabilis TaxID=179855 RepID=A0A9P6ETS6_9AGAR|nr:hypothetical protein CPB83DRAFT_210043 [Crepidotus variabilis]
MPKALTPLTCDYPECFKIFGRKGDLTRHKNIHLGRKPFECEYCHKKFAQFSGLKTHENVHNGNKPHVCGYDGCTAIFGDPSSCARHRKETHRRVGAYCCPEPYCSSRIKRRSAFAAHLKKHGIDSKNLDLESFAPPLLPESQKSTGRITRIESGSYERLPTLAEEFEDQFCGFTDGTWFQAPYLVSL